MKFDSSTKERSYGGKARIWLKKRKTRVFDDKILQSNASHSAVTEESDDANSDAKSPPGKAMIGWDDIKCRPIYQGSGNDLDITMTSPHGTPEYRVPNDGDDLQLLNAPEEQEVVSKKKSRQKYGSRTKRAKLDLSGAEDSVEGCNNNKFRVFRNKSVVDAAGVISSEDLKGLPSDTTAEESSHTTQTMQSSEDDESITISSPQPTRRSSICLTLNSEVKGMTVARRVTEHGEEISVQTHKMFLEDAEGPLQKATKTVKQVNRRKQVLRIRTNENEVEESLFEFKGSIVRQPCSNTSVAAANAFFEHLDSTQKIVLDSSEPPQCPGKRCIRTNRKTDICSTTLKNEHSRYVAATKGSGVEPLPLEEYAVNRSNFFRKSDMYDGFLDE